MVQLKNKGHKHLSQVEDHSLKPTRPAFTVKPVVGDEIECHVCGGGVKLIKAPFTDTHFGIHHFKTLVLASHKYGRFKCAGTYTKHPDVRQRWSLELINGRWLLVDLDNHNP